MKLQSFSYEKNPQEIYARSFELIKQEIDLSHVPKAMHSLIIRIVHAGGDSSLVSHIRFSADSITAFKASLEKDMPIFCDTEMVARGIIMCALKGKNAPEVTLNAPEVIHIALALNTTRSAAAVELWRDRLAGSIVVIGNAPTALFHLLEGIIHKGWPRPAVILGFPVGFVGAKESKDLLAASDLPFITLVGRRGGSAIASAAFNALTLGLKGDGR